MVLSKIKSAAQKWAASRSGPREPVIRKRPEHRVSRKDINEDALKVLYRLNRQGYKAYLVGGGVRDLLLGKHPKDFDVSTDAHPNQIKKLFRNCFLIGRRFRLAHIRFGDHVVETSTFRSQPEPAEGADADLYQHRDNTFGTPREDAMRRDFTVNGLFYDIATFEVIDYVGGLADLEQGVIRCIGDPDIRFREDPVRMIRALRFASRLDFQIEPKTWKAILRHHEEIAKASPARMLEELFKLFAHNVAAPNFRLLWRTGMMKTLMPALAEQVDRSGGETAPLWDYLAALDKGNYLPGEPTRALQVATLFATQYRDSVRELRGRGERKSGAEIAEAVLNPFARRYSLPKRQCYRALHILDMQRRFHPQARRFKKHLFVQQDYFPETFALRAIVLEAEGKDASGLDKWLGLYRDTCHKDLRLEPDKRPAEARKSSRRRPRRRKRPPGSVRTDSR